MWSADQLIVQSNKNLSIQNAVLFVLMLLLIRILWSRRYYYIVSWQLPGPVAYPIIGNLPTLLRNSIELFEYLNRVFKKYGPVMRLWVGPFLCVVVSDPRDVQLVTTSPHTIEKPKPYRFAENWMGNGLFIAKARIWRKHRKMIEHTFAVPILDTYMHAFNRESLVLVDQLKQHANTNEYFDLWHFTCRCTLDIVGQTMLGVKFNCQLKNEITNSYDNEYMKATTEAFGIILKRVIRIWLLKDSFFKQSKYYKDFQKCMDVFYNVTNAVIGSRHNREEFLAKQNLPNQKTMIDELFKNNDANKLSDKDLQDQLNTMVATGADATGNSLAIIFVLLAMHPEIQERLYQEIMSNLDDTDTDFIAKSSLNKMVYLDYVIKETLRIFPGSTSIARFTTADLKLKSRDVTVRKGTVILIAIGVLHRSTEVWGPDADVFNPDRWASPEPRHPFTFAAFSLGPRNCVGYKYAMLSMKIILVHALRQYRFTTEEKFEDIRFYLNLMSKKVGGCQIKIHTR